MDISVLGGLTVRENGVSITPTAPEPRQVLGLLALHADQVVHVSSLTEELWRAGRPAAVGTPRRLCPPRCSCAGRCGWSPTRRYR
ncbi:hypothetical protein [Streptomyces prasinus]|uniref:hypothetical protein n=1 Tax=Streptomyces prasinus TaxID=67345 RepID=UPI003401C611